MQTAATLKRKRTPNWSIQFDDATALKSVIEACAAVMQRIIVKVSRNEAGVFFLSVDGADVGYTCCVSARLQLGVVRMASDVDTFRFCVDCKQILYSIESPSSAHGMLTMESYVNDTSVYLLMTDPDQPSHVETSKLSTFVDGDPPVMLSVLDFKIVIEVDLTKLREMIKKARKAHAEHLGISVLYRDADAVATTTFSLSGDTEHAQIFSNDTSTKEDGSRLVRAIADGKTEPLCVDSEDVELLHDGKYPVDKIDAFVKTVPSRVVVAKVMKGMPLMFTHSLGASEDDSSHVRFLVASTSEDDS